MWLELRIGKLLVLSCLFAKCTPPGLLWWPHPQRWCTSVEQRGRGGGCLHVCVCVCVWQRECDDMTLFISCNNNLPMAMMIATPTNCDNIDATLPSKVFFVPNNSKWEVLELQIKNTISHVHTYTYLATCAFHRASPQWRLWHHLSPETTHRCTCSSWPLQRRHSDTTISTTLVHH